MPDAAICPRCLALTDWASAEPGDPFHSPEEGCDRERLFDPVEFHESHERYDFDCSECRAVLDIEMQANRSRGQDRVPIHDRELMQDEFHIR